MESVRLCFHCRIKWQCSPPEGTDCPKCEIPGCFTCNASDIGTAMLMNASGLTMRDFAEHTADPKEDA